MNFRNLYNRAKGELRQANIDTYVFDAMCLLEHCFGIKRYDLAVVGTKEVDKDKCEKFFKLVEQRAHGRPLQYIIGEWQFMGLTFKVGEGVLIPRDDTEVLVNEAANRLKGRQNVKVMDLCAGSGAVSISISKLIDDAKVFALELSDDAYKYLLKNVEINSTNGVTPFKGDVFKEFCNDKFKDLDAIVSNPPYIPSSDIEHLQREVQREPAMALDGGNDGLEFYREIADKWARNLKAGGFVAVEIGIGQSDDVANIFSQFGLSNIEIIKDINLIDRVVVGVKGE